MMRITHGTVGATAGLLIGWYTGQQLVFFAMIGAFFGILPDFDIFLQKIGLAEHRGAYSHSLLSSITLSAMAFIAEYQYPQHIPQFSFLVVFSATFLHSAADSLTRSGTHLFYPITKNRFSGSARYDSITINAVIIMGCAATLFLAMPELFLTMAADLHLP
ncbi:MAG: metal-dependent hydrolase [Candidatus Thermoplasmatota archaeon]|nr:metal-dependent hydrolase [Candidatus Thermoplasmatota archaeon]